MVFWEHFTDMVNYKVPTIERGIMIRGLEKIEVVTNKDKHDFVIHLDDHLFFVINQQYFSYMGDLLSFQEHIEPVIRRFGKPRA